MIKDAVIILCGGSSRRMGNDKASLIYKEKSFLEHAIISAKELSNTIFISVNTKEQEKFYTTLINNFGNFFQSTARKLTFLIDEFDFSGPLNGICTSIKHAISNDLDYVQFIPIDMPAIQPSDLIMLRSFGRSKDTAISSYIAEKSFISSLLCHLNINGYRETWQLFINSINKLLHKRVSALFRIAPTLCLINIPDGLSTRFNNINTKNDYQILLEQEFVQMEFSQSQLTNSPSLFKKQIVHGFNIESLQDELKHCTIPHLREHIQRDITLIS